MSKTGIKNTLNLKLLRKKYLIKNVPYYGKLITQIRVTIPNGVISLLLPKLT